MNDSPDNEVRRLPLWEACLEEMRQIGIDFGQTFQVKWLEKRLMCKHGSLDFNRELTEIRQALEYEGFYLSGQDQKGTQFIIVPPENNADIALAKQRRGIKEFRRAVVLLTNTRLDTLTQDQRRRHESVLERIGRRAALLNRTLPPALPSK